MDKMDKKYMDKSRQIDRDKMDSKGGGPTTLMYMATRFLPKCTCTKCTKMYKICFFLFGSSLDRFILAVANLQ